MISSNPSGLAFTEFLFLCHVYNLFKLERAERLNLGYKSIKRRAW
ncbi:hypothetical protein PPEP_a1564 [Pseudoalteromonas peptidolytica F12-50-A1]|uniref:Uncharacterized protein n=1 Tax=Pseudoalteromonas peptidolytica F12-50-A1 TaxID=1315280 RepID=A0A8I0T5A0_9GAMM|nr:hypothetical protein [Pseudoalteromonas peptidolytica F12-50-A1]